MTRPEIELEKGWGRRRKERRDAEGAIETTMELEAVGDLALNIIYTKLGPENVGRVACVNKKLMLSVSEDTVWAKFCSDDLDLSSPVDPQGEPLPSFKVMDLHIAPRGSTIFRTSCS